MDNNIINLENYRTKSEAGKSRIFSGRARGEDVRKKSRIDQILERYEDVRITIPEDIFSITPSFLEEFILNVVRKYGKEASLNKLKFTGSYKIEIPLISAVDNILLTKNGLN